MAHLSEIEQSLILAAYFRGNLASEHWKSSCDQVVTLSLFYTGELSAEECRARFATEKYVKNLYVGDEELDPQIAGRYRQLIELLRQHSYLVEGGGNFDTPADPTYTACRLTDAGVRVAESIVGTFPRKPDFLHWPDKRSCPVER